MPKITYDSFLHRPFKPGLLAKYPHISKSETLVIDSFWNTTKLNPINVYYSDPIYPNTWFFMANQPLIEMPGQRYNYALKVDMILEFLTEFVLIEVKFNLEPAAISQIEKYNSYWNKNFIYGKAKSRGLLFFYGDPWTIKEARKLGIRLFQVPETRTRPHVTNAPAF